ncbi:hypothetical protein OQY15_03070 [Pedobacter sp. MC2016-15]|uniref:hypothetical protein n=1 Tax=Pedobacter sp. MC2016-15 TaxID=2994473 RepID=UPI0022463641|nr:hypothetical protein [Pedobacter sp. MC2016-15]MCX2478055.1 hypothetical protein [Pedobacter sp. MC2016-15]
MISPLKYKPVNWVDGMKLSSRHFVHTDLYHQDFVRDASSVFINRFNYGLLPPSAAQRSSLDMEVTEKAGNQIEVVLRRCNAVTAEGCRIDIAPNAEYNNQISYTQYFDEKNTEAGLYHVLLLVNPFERVPDGFPDPEENPPRYPSVTAKYSIAILPATEIAPMATDQYRLTIGRLIFNAGKVSVDQTYIPPASCILSHPGLIRYYELFSTLMNELQLSAFKIIDKTTGIDSVTALGKNIRLLSEKLLDYLARVFFAYRNVGFQESPIYIAEYCANLAHVFFTGIKLTAAREREDMLKYFYEWRDVTPGNFEELLARTIELVYDHQNINESLSATEEFLKVLSALWAKLSTLEYIGQHKENIVVAEQQLVQQVQTKRTWTLLD